MKLFWEAITFVHYKFSKDTNMEQFTREIKKIYLYNWAFLKLIGARESIEGTLILLIGFFLYPNIGSYYLVISIFILISFVFFTQTLNDIYDIDIDSLNKRDKPLAQGLFSVRFAKYIAGYFFVCTIFFGLVANNIVYLFFSLILIALGFLYSHPATSFSKKPILALITIILGYVVIPFYMGIYSATSSFSLGYSNIILGLIFIVIGRVILKDIQDKKGDNVYGRKTLALLLKTKKLILLSSCLFILGILFTISATIKIIQKDFVFIFLSVSYLLFILWILFQRYNIPEEKQTCTIRSSLVKIYMASRLYLVIILGFLVF